jgi:prephenate dehydrogenase
MAAISHVPQLVAIALAATLGYTSVSATRLGPGGRDMTRLGQSSWSMWKPILAATPGRTLAMLESVESELRQMRLALLAGNLDEVGVSWSVARGWRLESQPAADK